MSGPSALAEIVPTGFRITTYVSADPLTPAAQRFVAHWFDSHGALQVATAVGASEEYCRERLAAFLSVEIARASVAKEDPEETARNRNRTARARAARAANRLSAKAGRDG